MRYPQYKDLSFHEKLQLVLMQVLPVDAFANVKPKEVKLDMERLYPLYIPKAEIKRRKLAGNEVIEQPPIEWVNME